MNHFVHDDGLNVFRLPVCWQYLVNNVLGGTLDSNNFGVYNQLVQGCLATGAYCVVDIHNYARWNNQIVGQSGSAVTNSHLASVWYQMYVKFMLVPSWIRMYRLIIFRAAKYASNAKVIFGIMNEVRNSSDQVLPRGF